MAGTQQDSDSLFNATAVAQKIKETIFGREAFIDQAVAAIAARLNAHARSTETTKRPRGIFLIEGGPGSGKTAFCKAFAKALRPEKDGLIWLDMVQYSQPYTRTAIVGSPPGYVGGEGVLTKGLALYPAAVVLLNDVEKTIPEISKIFAEAWTGGFMTDLRTSAQIPVTNAIFILTTNQAWDSIVGIAQANRDSKERRDQAIRATLKEESFPADLLDSVDEIFVLEPLDHDALMQVAEGEVKKLGKIFELNVTAVAPQYLANLVSDKQPFRYGGVRDLARFVENQLGDQMIDAKQKGARSVRIVLSGDKPVVEIDETTGS